MPMNFLGDRATYEVARLSIPNREKKLTGEAQTLCSGNPTVLSERREPKSFDWSDKAGTKRCLTCPSG